MSRAERNKSIRSAGEGGVGIGVKSFFTAACRVSFMNAIHSWDLTPSKMLQIGVNGRSRDDEI